ncbi:MAG: hypothetical protein IZT59_06740 [Verrucomicrobia bacterium]|nr:hypothetical protein [Verrucomicrobiota bacterium]
MPSYAERTFSPDERKPFFFGPIGGPEIIVILIVLLLLLAVPVIIIIVVLKLSSRSSKNPQPPLLPQTTKERIEALDDLKNRNLVSESEHEEKRKELLRQL